jgi:PAS domain S-box-containing protein
MQAEQEDRLRRLELEVARLRDVLDRAPSVSYTCAADPAYDLTSVTTNVRDLSGYPPARFLEDSSFWPSRIHAEDRGRVLYRLKTQQGASCTQVYRYRDAEGAMRWVRDTRRLLAATEEAEEHVAGVWLDITAEKDWEDKFARLNADFEGHVSDRTKMLVQEVGEHRRTRETLGQVIASARCLLWEADVAYLGGELQWRTDLIADESAHRVLSLDLEEGEAWYHASHRARVPEDDARMTETARAALLGGESGYSQDFRCVDRTGAVRWLHEDVHAETTGEDTWRVVGVTTDVTERKRAESLQAAVLGIAEAVHVAPDLPSMYARIHRSLEGLIDARNFYIALVNPDDPDTYSIPYCVDERHEVVPHTRSSLGKSRTARVVRTAEPLLLTRNATLGLVRAGDLELAGDPGEAWLGVPLVTEEGVIGVVAVLSYEDERRYTERDPKS